jgi:hypothetical protein
MTDPGGRARVEFALPDNLTAWRVTARAVSAATRGGPPPAGIRTTPSLVLFKNGEAIGTLTGGHSLERIQQFVDSANG